MNCNEARDLLSDYIDSTLRTAEREAVEAHMATCSDCSEGKDALAQLVADVANLDTVNPPPGFSQRIMTKIREEAVKPSFWEWLFVPLKIKIPIQVVSLLLVAGLAAYLYRVNPLVQEELGQMVPVDPNRSVATAPLPSKDSNLSDQNDEGEEQEVGSIQGFADTEKKRESAPEILAPSSTQMGAKVDSVPALDTPSLPPQKKESILADLELVFVPDTSTDREAIREKMEILIQEVGGTIPKRKEARGQFRKRDALLEETLWISLPKAQFKQFKNKLTSLGQITSEVKRALTGMSSSLQAEKSLEEAPTTLKSEAAKKESPALRIKLIFRTLQP